MRNERGQAAVEFTLCFMLVLVIAWIPADFGLAFYSSQLAQNAAREGARMAAADPCLKGAGGPCTIPTATDQRGTCVYANCITLDDKSVLYRTATRVSAALLGQSTITIDYPATGSAGCDQLVSARVQGQYPFFFYKLLRFMGFTVTIPTIDRTTTMRWEYQTACL